MRQLVSAVDSGSLICVLGPPVVYWHCSRCYSFALPQSTNPPPAHQVHLICCILVNSLASLAYCCHLLGGLLACLPSTCSSPQLFTSAPLTHPLCRYRLPKRHGKLSVALAVAYLVQKVLMDHKPENLGDSNRIAGSSQPARKGSLLESTWNSQINSGGALQHYHPVSHSNSTMCRWQSYPEPKAQRIFLFV